MFHCFKSVIGSHNHMQHQHDFHEIILLQAPMNCKNKGGKLCTHYVEDKSFDNYLGDLVLLPGNSKHVCRGHYPNGVACMVLYFDDGEIINSSTGDDDAEKILRALLDRAKYGLTIPLNPNGRKKAGDCMMNIYEEVVSKESGWRCAMKKNFLELLLCILRNWDGGQPLVPGIDHIERRERMAGVLRFLETSFMLPLSIEDVMNLSCLSRSHFHAVFKQETGHTFKEYLNHVRVRKAKQLIYSDGMPLAQIALACGFSSQSHFCHVFRKYTGRTPQQEKKRELPHMSTDGVINSPS